MLQKRRSAAIKVAQGLFNLEKAIDHAIAQAAELHTLMPAARTEANLSAVVGQEAFEGAAAVFAALAKARHHVVYTHQKLDEAKTQIGLRTVSFGDGTEKPPRSMALSLVEAVEAKAA